MIGGNSLASLTLHSKALMNKIRNCDFKGIIRVADDRDRFDNN